MHAKEDKPTELDDLYNNYKSPNNRAHCYCYS